MKQFRACPPCRVNLRQQKPQQGGSILESLASLGKTIISSPQVQQSAKDLATEATAEILKAIKSRTSKQTQTVQEPAKKRNPKIDQLLKGSGIRYLQ